MMANLDLQRALDQAQRELQTAVHRQTVAEARARHATDLLDDALNYVQHESGCLWDIQPKCNCGLDEWGEQVKRLTGFYDDDGTQDKPERPTVVCLCGSTRFWRIFQEASLRETLAGRIVLSIGAAVASDEEHFGHLSDDEKAAIKERLDELHLRKIDMANEVLILNVGGYIGDSTRRELAYAQAHGKRVRWLEEPTDA